MNAAAHNLLDRINDDEFISLTSEQAAALRDLLNPLIDAGFVIEYVQDGAHIVVITPTGQRYLRDYAIYSALS